MYVTNPPPQQPNKAIHAKYDSDVRSEYSGLFDYNNVYTPAQTSAKTKAQAGPAVLHLAYAPVSFTARIYTYAISNFNFLVPAF
jgi:hypothetical protein